MDREIKTIGGWMSKPVLGLLLAAVLVLSARCDSKPATVETPPGKASPKEVFEGTIVAVGDSLTAGLGVPEEKAYPAVLARKLKAAGYAYRVVNAGVSGETSSGTRSRIEWIVSSLDPDIVILETGANDGLRGIDPRLVESNLDAICTLLQKKNIVVLLAGMKMLPSMGPEYTKAFSSIYPRIARKHDLVFMPFILEDVAGVAAFNQSDGLHPTARGYLRMVDNIYPYVVKTIQRRREK